MADLSPEIEEGSDHGLTFFRKFKKRSVTQYRNLADDGRERGNSATIGIEDHTGEIALEVSMNEMILPAEPAVTSILFRPPGIP